jgi:hypothetical protein
MDFDLAMSAIHRYEEQSKLHSTAAEHPMAALLLSLSMN